jgi:hypothetical protein
VPEREMPSEAGAGAGWTFTTGVGWIGGAGAGSLATTGAGGTVGAVYAAPWRGKATVSEARQSFHSSVAMGGEVALPSNGLSKTARLTSFPAGMFASDVRMRSSWLRKRASAAASVVPGGARYTYSR